MQSQALTMSDDTLQITNQHKYSYGVHIPADNGPGYLLIRYLSMGSYATTALVYSIADGNIYVLKQELDGRARPMEDDPIKEVSNYIDHPNVPQLITHTSYEVLIPGSGPTGTKKTSTIWEFCNGGTLKPVLQRLFDVAWTGLQPFGAHTVDHKIPEVFVLKFLDVMLAVLLTNFKNGVTHNDIHPGNIFLHWPDNNSALPDIFLGDYGLSQAYPWRAHPRPKRSVPFKIDNIDTLDMSQPSRSVFSQIAGLFESTASQNAQSADQDRFQIDDLREWYIQCMHDVNETYLIATDFILNTPETQYRSPYMIHTRATKNEGLHGYSPETIQIISQIGQLIHGWRKQIKPFIMMRDLTNIHRRIHVARSTMMDTTPVEANILQLLRPPVVAAHPAIWHNYNSVVVDRGHTSQAKIRHLTEHWSFQLDWGQFEVRRIALNHKGLWDVVDYEDYTDEEDECGVLFSDQDSSSA